MDTEAGTSLMETLEGIDGHADHARYDLTNSWKLLQGRGTGDFDVAERWKVGAVAAPEWETLKEDPGQDYGRTMAHPAYHLGVPS